MSTNPNDTAFPVVRPSNIGNGVIVHNLYPGLSKREYIASIIMAGFATRAQEEQAQKAVVAKARDAVRQADALIQALNSPVEAAGGN